MDSRRFDAPSTQSFTEKSQHPPQTSTINDSEPSSHFPTSSAAQRPTSCTTPSRLHQYPRTCHNQARTRTRIPYTRPRGLRICNLFRSWLPIISYVATSLAFLLAIALYRDQVFARLDELSHWLQADPMYGQIVLFVLIFITTFPPIPLYSTLITLSGYTFGPWMGAIISYFAALSGALTVFIISRALFRESITRWLASYTGIRRVVRAIDKRPKLLFLIRLAPYPYNVMNCLLAAAPTLTLRTYTICTALSLFKVIIHTSLGASIHSFKDYHRRGSGNDPSQEHSSDTAARVWTGIGIILCVLIFVYLSVIARRAVDDELGDEENRCDNEETVAFLSPHAQQDCEALGGDPGADVSREEGMVESPLRPMHQMMPISASLRSDGHLIHA